MKSFTMDEVQGRFNAWRQRGEQTDSNTLAAMVGELLEEIGSMTRLVDGAQEEQGELDAAHAEVQVLTDQVAELQAQLKASQLEAAAAQQHASQSGS